MGRGGSRSGGHLVRAPNLRRADSTITIMAIPQQQEAIYQEGRIALAIQAYKLG